jgi:hypothetical protein
MKVEVREEEITKLKNKIINLKQQVRNFQQSQKAAENKAAFSDADKLMILESVLLSIVGTEALEFITRKLIASFADNDFWKDHKHKDTDKILLALAKK